MRSRFRDIAFTDGVKRVQEAEGSRAGYARMTARAGEEAGLGPNEAAFIAARDSFYIASVSETGWPYVQHRGGPAGFLRMLDAHRIGFVDLSGNRQYVSVGNLGGDDRVSLILMDYPNRARLKILGRARVIADDDTATLARLQLPGYETRVERGIVITIEAFDWNCPQYITPRFTEAEIAAATAPLRRRIADLEAKLAAKS
jgi:predicted pyridoxine 5'-phosphate oxidase superfamily flavin-nucleotide-binding protein